MLSEIFVVVVVVFVFVGFFFFNPMMEGRQLEHPLKTTMAHRRQKENLSNYPAVDCSRPTPPRWPSG